MNSRWGNNLLRKDRLDFMKIILVDFNRCNTAQPKPMGKFVIQNRLTLANRGPRAGAWKFILVPMALALLWHSPVQGASGTYTFTTFAGPDAPGTGAVDATGRSARFSNPTGVAVDASGNVYVADSGNNTIRKINSAGVVTTLAGTAGINGSADGTGSAASFNFTNGPNGIAVDASGNVYVADTYNSTIRKITSGGVVTTLAGTAGVLGSTDGTGSGASFVFPTGVAVDVSGNVYVADSSNETIRKITSAGVVTTLAGAQTGGSADGTGSVARFNFPTGVAVDSSGNVYVADQNNRIIRKITSAGVVTTLAGTAGQVGSADATGSAASFFNPTCVAVDASGNVYVTDNNTIRKITSAGVVTTLAGTFLTGTFLTVAGSTDGTGSAASFNQPSGIAVDASGNVYVADSSNSTIRKITPAGVVTTFASTAPANGSADGAGRMAGFSSPTGVAVDASGNVYVADTGNNTIRKITSAAVVTTLAGTAGTFGSADGTGSAATFSNPYGVAVDASGNVYVADPGNSTIRKITSAGVVTTLAGTAGVLGHADGIGSAASFSDPYGVAVDVSGNVYVSDSGNNTIRKITPAGVVTTLAGTAGVRGSADGTGSAASFSYPYGVAVDASGNVYVTDYLNNAIRKITSAGAVTTFGGVAPFSNPSGVAIDVSGNVYVADSGNNLIRNITSAGVVTTLAGNAAANSGNADGTGSAALFSTPTGVAVDASGNVYVTDRFNNNIRIGVPALADIATIDAAAGAPGAVRQLNTVPQTGTTFSWSFIRYPSASTATLSSATIANPTFTPDVQDIFIFQLISTSAAGESISFVTLTGSDGSALVSLSPSQATIGDPSFTLTVTGTNLLPSSVVQWSGQANLTPITQSSTQLTVSVPASYLAQAGIVSISLFTPGPGGGVSTSLNFAVLSLGPVLSAIAPTTVPTGDPTFVMTLTGSNFVPASVVNWSGKADLVPIKQTATQLTVSVPASYIAASGIASITVTNPAPGGGVSASLNFTVASPVPVLSAIAPTTAPTGGPAFVLTLTGSNFVHASVVNWSGQADLVPLKQTATQLTVLVPASYISASGIASITVTNPAPGGASAAQTIAVNYPPPILNGIGPLSATVGGPAFTLTLSGANFVSGAVVNWQGLPNLTPDSESSKQITLTIPASYIAALGAFTITVTNPPSAGGFISGTQTFTVNPPAPVITSATADNAGAGIAYSYTITATNSPISFTAAGLPTGLSLNPSTGVISGITATVGTFTVALSASNSGGSGLSTLTLTVNQIGVIPLIYSSSTSTGSLGQTFTYATLATNLPTRFSADNLPPGFSIDPASGIISGVNSAGGVFNVTLSAVNAQGTGQSLLEITVGGENVAANIVSAMSATGEVGVPFQFGLSARGAIPIAFSATGLPAGLTLSGSVISGTPTAAGLFHVSVSATNTTVTSTGASVTNTSTQALTLIIFRGSADLINSDVSTLDTNPNDPNSALFGGSPGAPQALTISTLGIKLNFAHASGDSITMSGILPIPIKFLPTDKALAVDIGGVVMNFKLNGKGQAVNAGNSFKMKLNVKKDAAAAQNALFSLKLPKGDFRAAMAADGLINTDLNNIPTNLPVVILFNLKIYEVDQPVVYTAKQGKMGTVKNR